MKLVMTPADKFETISSKTRHEDAQKITKTFIIISTEKNLFSLPYFLYTCSSSNLSFLHTLTYNYFTILLLLALCISR